MATIFACDATGKAVKDKAELVEVGVRGRLYCKEIADEMQAYVKEYDELHEKCAAAFREGVAEINAKYRAKIAEDGKLPNE